MLSSWTSSAVEASCEGSSTTAGTAFVAFLVTRFGAADALRFAEPADDDFFAVFFSVTSASVVESGVVSRETGFLCLF